MGTKDESVPWMKRKNVPCAGGGQQEMKEDDGDFAARSERLQKEEWCPTDYARCVCASLSMLSSISAPHRNNTTNPELCPLIPPSSFCTQKRDKGSFVHHERRTAFCTRADSLNGEDIISCCSPLLLWRRRSSLRNFRPALDSFFSCVRSWTGRLQIVSFSSSLKFVSWSNQLTFGQWSL